MAEKEWVVSDESLYFGFNKIPSKKVASALVFRCVIQDHAMIRHFGIFSSFNELADLFSLFMIPQEDHDFLDSGILHLLELMVNYRFAADFNMYFHDFSAGDRRHTPA